LYLSRVREYYADEFSAKKTGNPDFLSSALIKIAYGIAITPDTEKTAHLLNNTRSLGIFDFKASKDTGLIYQNSRADKKLMQRALLFDIVNPWAWFTELSSTHPLIGKRVRRLSSMARSSEFNFDTILASEKVDKGKLWSNFFSDFFIKYSVWIVTLLFIGGVTIQFFLGVNYYLESFIALFVIAVLLSVLRINYMYPMHGFKDTEVLTVMSDIYASPVKGRPVNLSGQAIGRGQAGYVFGKDMIFQDRTGIIYLNYEGGIPLLGNLIFAWKKLEQLLHKPSQATGWFFRGATHYIALRRINVENQAIKSYVRFWSIFPTVFGLLILGAILFFIFNIVLIPYGA
jgi:hypothetical protein